MDNVAPEEGVTITEGRARPFSVDVKIAIPYNVDETYMVTYASGGIAHHPFRVHFSDTLGTTQFSGKITWYDDVCGQEKTITLALYRLEATPTGRVEEKTLLKEIQRRYDIRCDRSQFALFRFAKETLGLCKDI